MIFNNITYYYLPIREKHGLILWPLDFRFSFIKTFLLLNIETEGFWYIMFLSFKMGNKQE